MSVCFFSYDSRSWSLGDGQYKDMLYEYACVPHWDVLIERELLTEICINSETCWSTPLQLSNTMCRTLSQSGRVVHSLLYRFWLVHWCLSMRYIHNWLGDPRRIWCSTSVRAWSCLVLGGLLCYSYKAHSLVVNATICRGPWACVVCSVRCFACWESGGLLWDHGRRSI